MFLNSITKIKKEYFAFAIFFILIAVFYGNTLFNGFVLDDRAVIRDNPYVHSLEYLPKVFTGCIWENAIGGCKGKTLHYQPLHTLTYLLTWQISSSPWFFHLINLLYFLTAVLLVFVFVRTLTDDFYLSFFTALIFTIHPINNEVVAWISTANDILAAIFVILSLLLFTKFRQTGSRKYFIFALIFYFLAMLAKEPTIVAVPLLVFSLDLLFWQKLNLTPLFSKRKRKKKATFRFSWDYVKLFISGNQFFRKVGEFFKKEIKNYLCFGAVFIFYFTIRNAVIGAFGGLASEVTHLGSFSRIYYFFWLFWQYIKKLFFPYPLIFINELTEKLNLSSFKFLALVFLFLAFWVFLFFAVKTKRKIVAFSLFWIFIYVLPMLVFYNVAGDNIFAERYLFVSTIGFSLMASYFLNYFWRKGKTLKYMVSLFLFLVICLSFWIVYNRNKTWKSDITFFEANIKQNPNVSKNREYLADVLREQGDIEGAKIQWEEIVRRDPNWKYVSHSYNNIGDYYRQKGDFEKAQEYYEKAIQASDRDGNYKSYNNMGALMIEQSQYLKALLYFCKALKVDSLAPEPLNNFNRIASMVASVDSENFIFLYMDVMDGQEFKKSEAQRVFFKRKECLYDNCFYVFSPQLPQNEIMLPFLIMAKAFPEEIVQVSNPQFNQKTNEIAISVDKKYQDRLITFYFPTCEGVYYEVATGD